MPSNYPDDIRKYDNNPMSPFYKEPDMECENCGSYKSPDNMYTFFCGDDRLFCSESCINDYEDENYTDLVEEFAHKIEKLDYKYGYLVRTINNINDAQKRGDLERLPFLLENALKVIKGK